MVACETILAGPLALAVRWRDDRIAELGLDWAEGKTASAGLSATARELLAVLERYVQGQKAEWPDLPLDYSQVTPFALKVLMTLKLNVGWGVWTTYGQLAELAGKPGGARAVGQVMASNPWPLVVPCHRVLSAGRGLGGFSGAGLPMKSFLLQLEGINVFLSAQDTLGSGKILE